MPDDQKAEIINSIKLALRIAIILDNCPTKAGAWFKHKYLQNGFKLFFGRHNLHALNKFRTVLTEICQGYDESVVNISIIDRRDSLMPHYQFIDLSGVYAETNIETKTISIGESFFRIGAMEKAYTLFHEFTHLFGGTQDFELTASLSQENIHNFAQKNPEKALECAYCYEKFVATFFSRLDSKENSLVVDIKITEVNDPYGQIKTEEDDDIIFEVPGRS